MPGSESLRHRQLKALAVRWAMERGFSVAGVEVSVPRLGFCRLDVAAYQPISETGGVAIGTIAVFECKQSRADFLRDTRCEQKTLARLEKLGERLAMYEGFLKEHHPTLRAGDELFPQFETFALRSIGYEPYEELRSEIAALTRRLHVCTKFSRLARWRAANLHYVVAEPGVARPCELPGGWGLLERTENSLTTTLPALWSECPEANRWNLLLRIAKCGTRALVRTLETPNTPSSSPARGAAELETSPQPNPRYVQ